MRVKLNSIICLLVLFLCSSFHPAENGTLTITITNLRNNNGHVLISLFKEGTGYPDKVEKAFRKATVAITNKTAIINLTGLPTGSYAIAILHDENDDHKMNTNILGIPKEGYGFSNNVMGTFGPPSYSKASFTYTANTTIGIQLKTRY